MASNNFKPGELVFLPANIFLLKNLICKDIDEFEENFRLSRTGYYKRKLFKTPKYAYFLQYSSSKKTCEIVIDGISWYVSIDDIYEVQYDRVLS